jgi:hypothetical protein
MGSSYAVTDFEVNGRKTIKFFEMKVCKFLGEVVTL